MAAREAVLRTLWIPRCPRELRVRTRLGRKTVEGVLIRLLRAGLVVCLTPSLRQSRVYALTPLGRAWVAELPPSVEPRASAPDPGSPSPSTSPSPLVPDAHPPSFWLRHGWVQAGCYRRLVVRHLAEPVSARQLRRSILHEHRRIGSNHVRATLRELEERGITRRVEGLWSLTDLGRRLQAVDRIGLPERPPDQAWVRA